MTTPTTPAEAMLMQQAVDALMECDRDGDYPLIAELNAAIDRLAALAAIQVEPQEPWRGATGITA
jgi:hypothetical protein